ncbi:MAG TPA: beta-hydroxyacyl-ACP dehydratase [Phycisphaeraceae bacterium]|nr:beta-hydroxyacyl-ACP dehydratase [Phycisphaeraceae bacterium]
MHFNLVDKIIEQSDCRIVTLKQVSLSEEYLQDHFPGFPVLPGVMMLEALVASARQLLHNPRLVLGKIRALRYGGMVRPGDSLLVTVTLHKDHGDGTYTCKGTGKVVHPEKTGTEEETAITGKILLRPVQNMSGN